VRAPAEQLVRGRAAARRARPRAQQDVVELVQAVHRQRRHRARRRRGRGRAADLVAAAGDEAGRGAGGVAALDILLGVAHHQHVPRPHAQVLARVGAAAVGPAF
jgi:hypothetical protein